MNKYYKTVLRNMTINTVQFIFEEDSFELICGGAIASIKRRDLDLKDIVDFPIQYEI